MMTHYKTEKRKAEVGERILITNAEKTGNHYTNGDVLTVVESTTTYVIAASRPVIWHHEYEVIIGEQTLTPNLDEMDYDELIALVEAVMKAIRTRSYKNGYDQGRFDADIEAVHGTREKSDQQKRDEIVAQAKEDVRVLYYKDYIVDTDFIVNAEKRTVVALRKSKMYGHLKSKGIAKCAPDDCFNVHIGKAIALRRALGFEVPSEYLNVPQPTEVRDGDYVEHNVGNERRVVSREGKFPPINKPFVGLSVVKDHISEFKIVDDSRSEGGA
ncbi:hypothetical protein [Bacillus pumilus]|uniref:hypothetical protein n=1 Tax=Bacillus pumilus TaxID=1408 RepID=UPI0015D52A80|nr:hypothetical protein [Bacillus pumilus]QLI77101.1 hypothetical protein HZ310_04460 [Bacillus pumilus]